MLGTFTLMTRERCAGCGAEIPAGAVAVVSAEGQLVCSVECARTADDSTTRPAREERHERSKSCGFNCPECSTQGRLDQLHENGRMVQSRIDGLDRMAAEREELVS